MATTMKIPRTLNLAKPTIDTIQRQFELMSKALSRNISFGSTTSNTDPDMNISGWKATGTTPGTANTEFSITHWVTHVPVGFIILSTQPAGHIYKSTTAWTSATKNTPGAIYLKSDTASVAYTLMII